jgi:hypothetical protein
MTLSTPVKVIALAGLALVLGAGGLLLLTSKSGKSGAATAATAPPVKVVHIAAPAHHVRSAKPKLQLDPSLPTAVRSKLLLSHRVVAFVYTGASSYERGLLTEARAGAHAAHVPFVALDVTNEHVADQVIAWASSSADPNVLIAVRPGRIAFQLQGPTDRETVAQAAAAAR